MPSWRDVQAYSLWPPYQVMEPYHPFVNGSVEDFTIGSETCDIRHVGYCNGPLKSGSTYRVKIRAFTAPDKFTDTSYSFPIKTGKKYYQLFYNTYIYFFINWVPNNFLFYYNCNAHSLSIRTLIIPSQRA